MLFTKIKKNTDFAIFALGHDMMSPRHAAEAPEMTADIADDLTDSQLCAMDWSSQVPQDIG